jgi:hypothetical protein
MQSSPENAFKALTEWDNNSINHEAKSKLLSLGVNVLDAT